MRAPSPISSSAEDTADRRRRFLRTTGMLGVGMALGGVVPPAAHAARVKEVTADTGGAGAKACVANGKPCWIGGNAADQLKIEVLDPRFYQYVGDQFRFDELFDGATWAEGPAWLPKQKALIFSDVKKNVMYRWTESGGTEVFRQPSHFANGNAVDREGNLFTAEHGRRGISRTDARGNVQLLVDKLEGRRLNSPNGIAVRSDGTVWFTDPPYGILSDEEGKKAPSEMVGSYVYRFDPQSGRINIATFEMFRPNGLAFSPDEKHLYVAEMSSVEFKENGMNHIILFDVDGQKLKNRRVLAEIRPGIPDGLTVRSNGIIFCSSGNGMVALLPDGTELGRFIIGKTTSNGVFADEHTLFITASNSLYRLKSI